MLICYRYTNTLPIEKLKKFVNFDVFSVEIAIEKERKKEGKNISKQMR